MTRAHILLKRYQRLENELKTSYDNQGWEAENKVVNNIKCNPKAFYSYARARQKTKVRVDPFLDPSTGAPNPDPDYAAKVLSDQYNSVFTLPRHEYLVNDLQEFFSEDVEWRQQHEGRPTLGDISFTEDDVESACKELKASSAAGPQNCQ